MFRGKVHTVIGLTVYHTECLMLSVPALSRLSHDFMLIICNTNPAHTVTVRDIRKLGYGGRVHIINSDTETDLIRARLDILDAVPKIAPNAQWITFVNDTDVLSHLHVPDVLPNNFAVIQSAVLVDDNILDVLRVMNSVDWRALDDKNLRVMQPYMGLSGTLVRMVAAHQMGLVLHRVYDGVSTVCGDMYNIMVADAVMLAVLNHVVRSADSTAVPIYMDTVNLMRINLRGARAISADKIARATTECLAVVNASMASDN